MVLYGAVPALFGHGVDFRPDDAWNPIFKGGRCHCLLPIQPRLAPRIADAVQGHGDGIVVHLEKTRLADVTGWDHHAAAAPEAGV